VSLSDEHHPWRAHLDRQRAALPLEPGVYIYKDAADKVLYVGKAKSLRKRVNSYFSRSHDARTHALVMRIRNIEVFVVGSEAEALMFEQRLVRRHRPPFNVMLRDDKSYPYIAVTLTDDFPRVLFTREPHRPGTRYFGPYSNARRVRQTLDLLNRVFPYRPCEGPQPGRQSGVPCLDYHIERCAAPCVGLIDKEAYRRVIDQVMDVLGGRVAPMEKLLTAQMQQASNQLEFERAARLRNRLDDLRGIAHLQAAERPGQGSFDALAAATGEDGANVQSLQVREGQLADRASHFLENAECQTASTVLTQFALAWYGEGRPVPPQIVVPEGALTEEDAALLTDELGLLRGAKVEIREARRGEKRRLVELAERNARHALDYDSIKERTKVERRERALEELREELGLESLPLRIECYDISNLQEESPVASMVVFEDGRPLKAHYRKFAMRHTGGQDDFAMMGEVIRRRFARLASAVEQGTYRRTGEKPDGELEAVEPENADPEAVDPQAQEPGAAEIIGPPSEPVGPEPVQTGGEDEKPDESFASFPDLVLIDGGKGQLSAALESLRELGIERVSLCSLAKREELIHVPGRPEPIGLSHRSPGLNLLQRVRNEAHRFAVGYHRTRRSNNAQGSVLDTLQGIGPARRRALLTFFGSPEKVLSASLDELQAVPGLPGKVARDLYEQLNRLGTRETAASPARAADPPASDDRGDRLEHDG
jgi:excinuclease ABC subunit C